jgi:hypothetical protein
MQSNLRVKKGMDKPSFKIKQSNSGFVAACLNGKKHRLAFH